MESTGEADGGPRGVHGWRRRRRRSAASRQRLRRKTALGAPDLASFLCSRNGAAIQQAFQSGPFPAGATTVCDHGIQSAIGRSCIRGIEWRLAAAVSGDRLPAIQALLQHWCGSREHPALGACGEALPPALWAHASSAQPAGGRRQQCQQSSMQCPPRPPACLATEALK